MDKMNFDMMKNGYNRYQVDKEIGLLNDQNELLQKQISLYQNEYESLALQLKSCRNQLSMITQDLTFKEKAANQMTARVIKESNLLINCAQQNADVIIKEALMTARGILLDIDRIGKEAKEVKGSMKKDLKQIQNAIDNFDVPQIPNETLLK